MVLVAAGIVVGPAALDVLPGTRTSEPYLVLAELTLAVLLFADASTVRLREVEGDVRLPGRLLLIGLPVTIALGTVVARIVFPSQPWGAAALIASILAPTDVALGLPVISNAAVPNRIRRALNVESGLNDGIATPFVTLFLLMVAAEEHTGPANWLAEALADLGLAVATALVVGVVGGVAARHAVRRGWTTPASRELLVLTLALLSYAAALAIGGNGFVAAFLGGIVFGAASDGVLREPTEFAENVGLFASFVVWTLFGAFFAGPQLIGDGTHVDAIAVRRPQPHRHPDPPGRARHGGGRPASGDGALRGVVRAARPGLRRVPAHRGRGRRRHAGGRRPRLDRDVDDRAFGAPAWAHRATVVRCVRSPDRLPRARSPGGRFGSGTPHPPAAVSRVGLPAALGDRHLSTPRLGSVGWPGSWWAPGDSNPEPAD